MKAMSNSEVPYLKSMVFCLNRVINDGYSENFKATPAGLQAMDADKLYTPQQVKVVNFFRFEGFAIPNESAVMYVLETEDGTKGTLIDIYTNGLNNPVISNFITEVHSTHNNSVRH